MWAAVQTLWVPSIISSIILKSSLLDARRLVAVSTPSKRRQPLTRAAFGVFHGMKSYFCQDKYGQIAPVYSISAGLDYPGIGPEHAWLHDTGRAQYVPVTDDEAVDAFEYLSRMEGIIPVIESAHAVALCLQDRAEDEQRSNHGSHAFWSWRQATAPQLPVTEEKISMSNPRIKAAFKGWQPLFLL